LTPWREITAVAEKMIQSLSERFPEDSFLKSLHVLDPQAWNDARIDNSKDKNDGTLDVLPFINGIVVRLSEKFLDKFLHLEQTFKELLKSDLIVHQLRNLLDLESDNVMHLNETQFLHWILQKKDEVLYGDLQKYYLSLDSNEF
jgi:hypothetical protein